MRAVESSCAVDESGTTPADELLFSGASYTELVLARVRAMARRRLAWLQTLGLNAIGPTSPNFTHATATVLDDLDSPNIERQWAESDATARVITRVIDRLTDALRRNIELPMHQLVRTLELSDAEIDVIEVCLALELDSNLAATYAQLQQHPAYTYATEALVSRLTGRPREPLLSRASLVVRWEVIEMVEVGPGEPYALRLDPQITDFLCGRFMVDPVLFEAASKLRALPPPPVWPVAELVRQTRQVLAADGALCLTLIGPRGSGRRTLAACIAESFGLNAVGINTTVVSDADWPRVCLHAERHALLLGNPIVWHGETLGRRHPKVPRAFPLQFIATNRESQPAPYEELFEERSFMPQLTVDERIDLWRRLVPTSCAWPPDELAGIAERFRLQIGDIANIGRRPGPTVAEANELCRQATRGRLDELAQLVECTFVRDDLALPDLTNQRLDEFLFEAKDRARFWEEPSARRLFPSKVGLVALFAGPPGTGKTMAAQVVAAELGLDLIRIDVASLVSKYIGETAKNLRRIFIRSEEMNAVLLFDEADALFSKRTEVRDSHDRYANADTNYLLQMLESYGGIAILSSNKRENIDTAFVRRIRYTFEFPRPAAAERLRIWRSVVGELAGTRGLSELADYLERIAQTFDTSGAQIKSAVLTAIFAARRSNDSLNLSHIFHGIGRELLKEGRGITPKERERIEQYA